MVVSAHTLPCLVTLRCRLEMIPPMVTVAPSGCSPPVRDAMPQSAFAARMCSTSRSGWPET